MTAARGGRKPGVDKTTSEAINVIILRAALQDNSMVGGFLGWGSSKASKFMNQSEALRWRAVNMSVLMHLLDELCRINNN
jgi:hypothetical protein